MSNCNQPSNSCDQRPVGSPAVANSCSPCAEIPSPETMASSIATALAKICELETRLNNWNILLQRERNRTAALENQIKVKKTTPSRVTLTGGCGGEEADIVDALSGCLEGSPRNLNLAECQVPMMTEDGIKGVTLEATWLPAKVLLRSGSFSNTTYTYQMATYDPPKCAKWAFIQIVMGVFANSTDAAYNSQLLNILPNGVETSVAIAGTSKSAYASDTVTARVPISNGEVKFRAIVGTTHTVRSLSLNLVGFE